MLKYIIGIDEAGRGPLAGPVAVGAVCMPVKNKNFKFATPVRDCKQLSVSQRERLLAEMVALRQRQKINFTTALVGHKLIDEKGIVAAVRLGIRRCLARLAVEPACCLVLLDGSLRAPDIFANQKTIVRGDESEMVIALASVAAKVRRDRYLTTLARRYPRYGFDVHKGYGTAAHYRALKAHGLSPVHRRTFVDLANIPNTLPK